MTQLEALDAIHRLLDFRILSKMASYDVLGIIGLANSSIGTPPPSKRLITFRYPSCPRPPPLAPSQRRRRGDVSLRGWRRLVAARSGAFVLSDIIESARR